MFKKRGEVKEYSGFFAKHKLWMASATLIGTIIGAGILALPYVIAKAGFFYGLFLLIFLGIIMLFVNLFVGEIVLSTKGQHQLTGYAERYLGKWGKRLFTFSMVFGIYGALTAYLIGEGETLYNIVSWGSPLLYSILFFLFGFFIIYRGVKATGRAEMILTSLMFLIVIVVGILTFKKINYDYFFISNPAYIFYPYGAILFAYLGAAAIPEMQEELGKDKKLMKKAIIIGSLVPIILYTLFAFLVIGIVGLENFEGLIQEGVQPIATIALGIFSSPLLGKLANIIAICTMFTSFLTLGIALTELYQYDFKLTRKKSLLLTFALPLLLVIFGLKSFISIILISGAVAGGLEGILIVLMYWKAKKLWNRKPEYSMQAPKAVGYIIIAVFALGIIYQIWDQLLSKILDKIF
ncbi:amino acid permease [Candidatus Woesearchaeota archaeon]|nr:amino acid permease [Candidatus Woesearchaeota archaeon]